VSVYLDHNASAPVRPEAVEAVMRALRVSANPSSVHGAGRAARALVERSRAAIARSICAQAEDLIFTSGGTEANNLAIHAVWSAALHSSMRNTESLLNKTVMETLWAAKAKGASRI
jgi:cysteine desulfurase